METTYQAQLRKSIADSIARTKASLEAREKGATKYWYYISYDYCPVCGHSDTSRERMYTLRPEKYEDRHEFQETYDNCDY